MAVPITIAYSPLTIGSDQHYGDFKGYIDEVLVCPYAMTDAEIAAHWSGRPSMENAGMIPRELPQHSYTDVAPKPSPGGCGHNMYWNSGEQYSTNLQLVGGVPSSKHEFPWFAALVSDADTNEAPARGKAILISDKWLILTGHVFENKNKDPA